MGDLENQVPSPADPAKETDWKAEARKWEERAKSNKAALDSLTSEHDSAVARLTDLESVNSELSSKVSAFESEKEHAQLVAKVAEAVGVDSKALRGSTEEELTEHAEYLKGILDSRPSAPVIPSQAMRPDQITDNPEIEAVRSLFG